MTIKDSAILRKEAKQQAELWLDDHKRQVTSQDDTFLADDLHEEIDERVMPYFYSMYIRNVISESDYQNCMATWRMAWADLYNYIKTYQPSKKEKALGKD